MKKMTLTRLRHTTEQKYWYATDYEAKTQFIEGYGHAHPCYLILNADKKPVELEDSLEGKNVSVIIDVDGYAFVPAFLNAVFS